MLIKLRLIVDQVIYWILTNANVLESSFRVPFLFLHLLLIHMSLDQRNLSHSLLCFCRLALESLSSFFTQELTFVFAVRGCNAFSPRADQHLNSWGCWHMMVLAVSANSLLRSLKLTQVILIVSLVRFDSSSTLLPVALRVQSLLRHSKQRWKSTLVVWKHRRLIISSYDFELPRTLLISSRIHRAIVVIALAPSSLDYLLLALFALAELQRLFLGFNAKSPLFFGLAKVFLALFFDLGPLFIHLLLISPLFTFVPFYIITPFNGLLNDGIIFIF